MKKCDITLIAVARVARVKGTILHIDNFNITGQFGEGRVQ